MEKIIAKCLKNNAKAKKQLYDLFSGKVMAICCRYANSSFEADDIFQNTFCKVFQSLHQFDPNRGDLGGWIYRITVNEALKQLKKNNLIHFEEEPGNSDYYNYSSNLSDNITLEELKSVINKLPKGQKTIFYLYAVDGYNHKEIAEMLDISEGTSKSQYSRAKVTLKEHLKIYNS